MEIGWAAALQAAIIAISTLIVRSGSKKDAKSVTDATASKADGVEILWRVKRLEADVAVLKRAQAPKLPGTIDDRGPKKI